MTYIFTANRFPQQHGNEFQERSKCSLTTNTYEMKLNTSRKLLMTLMVIQIE